MFSVIGSRKQEERRVERITLAITSQLKNGNKHEDSTEIS